LDRGRDVLQSAADFSDRLIAGAATHFLIRRTEDKQHAAGDGFCCIRSDQFMAEHGKIVMLAWERGAAVAAALLFDRESDGAVPVELGAVLREERAIVLPGHRTQDVTALAVAAGHR